MKRKAANHWAHYLLRALPCPRCWPGDSETSRTTTPSGGHSSAPSPTAVVPIFPELGPVAAVVSYFPV